MQRLHCASHLHYGSMGYTGYDPSIWKLCGWSWQPGGANYRKERCAAKGAYPPFPFMNGALELLSAPIVRYVGTSPEVAARRPPPASHAARRPLPPPSLARALAPAGCRLRDAC